MMFIIRIFSKSVSLYPLLFLHFIKYYNLHDQVLWIDDVFILPSTAQSLQLHGAYLN
jgi:hypothetical protein